MENEQEIMKAKELRVDLDRVLQRLKTFQDQLGRSPAGRHCALSVTHTEDAIMRLGMVCKELGVPNPYPDSYDPSNAKVAPTADNLKM